LKAALIDTDILSLFLRGNKQIVDNAQAYTEIHTTLNFSIIT